MFNWTILTMTCFVINAVAADKYEVSHEEASRILQNLKKEASQSSVRPEKLSILNGGSGPGADPQEFIKICRADEDQFQEIQKSVINPWLKAWMKKDSKAFEALMVKDGKLPKFAVGFAGKAEKIGNIGYHANWNDIKTGSLKDYLEQYKNIEDLEISTLKFTSLADARDNKARMMKADLHIQYDLRGITQKGQRRNDRGPIKVSVVKIKNEWKIQEVSNWGLETLVNEKPSFEEYTQTAGLNNLPEYKRLEAIRRGGYAIAMGDVDNDGIQDMYVGALGPGKLLKGKKDGVFVAMNDSGLEQDTLVKSATFADFNNDGYEDLLLTRFVPPSQDMKTYSTDILVYQNKGQGQFKKIESLISHRSPAENAMPASVGDFNGDGMMDFYVGFPGAKDFTVLGKIPEREGLRAQGVYLNLGNFKFSENNVEKINKMNERNRIYPHSSMAFDFDQDGDTDIVVIDDRGNVSPAYQNDGHGHFIQAQQYIGINMADFGMGMAAADIDNNGILDLVFTNVNFLNKNRIDDSCKTNWNHRLYGEQDHGLKFYYGMKKGQFADATMKNGLFYAGEGLAGLEFFDYNNDGFQDLYVANGLWSGTDREQDLGPNFVQSMLMDDERVLMENRTDTQSSIMKILAGFTGDIVTGKKGDKRPHLAGFQRNRLFACLETKVTEHLSR
jgi:hypothetical protein